MEPVWPPDLIRVLFVGGPADGAIRCAPVGDDGQPAELIMLRGDGVFVGAADQSAPAALAAYRLLPEQRIEQYRVYEHVGTLIR
jgi:hypothetical protein